MQKSSYQIKTWGAFANGTWTIVRSILKENAVRRLQLIDASVTEDDVRLSNMIVSSRSCDEVTEECDGRGDVHYSVRFREEEHA